MDSLDQYSPGRGFIFTAFKIVVMSISALTSFAFFVTFLPSFIPSVISTEQGGSLITGLVGVMLLDVACISWLYFRSHAETGEQGTLAMVGASATFIGSALASIAYLALSASEMVLEAQTIYMIQMVSLIGIIVAVVLNFGLAIMYEQQSEKNQANDRERKRQHQIVNTEAQQEQVLTAQIQTNMLQALKEMAPGLAAEGSDWYTQLFQDRQRTRYGQTPVAVPNGHRIPEEAKENGV